MQENKKKSLPQGFALAGTVVKGNLTDFPLPELLLTFAGQGRGFRSVLRWEWGDITAWVDSTGRAEVQVGEKWSLGGEDALAYILLIDHMGPNGTYAVSADEQLGINLSFLEKIAQTKRKVSEINLPSAERLVLESLREKMPLHGIQNFQPLYEILVIPPVLWRAKVVASLIKFGFLNTVPPALAPRELVPIPVYGLPLSEIALPEGLYYLWRGYKVVLAERVFGTRPRPGIEGRVGMAPEAMKFLGLSRTKPVIVYPALPQTTIVEDKKE